MQKQKQTHRRQRLILDLYRLRLGTGVAQQVQVERTGSYSGCTVKAGGRTVACMVPTFEDAYGRTIRVHESVHAKMRRIKGVDDGPWSEITKQLMGDLIIHLPKWKATFPTSVHRDALTVALKDFRQVIRYRSSAGYPVLMAPSVALCTGAPITLQDIEQHNMAVLIACRAWGIRWRCVDYLGKRKRGRQTRRLARALRNIIPQDYQDTFKQIRTRVLRKEYEAACHLIEDLLIKPPPTDPDWCDEDAPVPDLTPTEQELDPTGVRQYPLRIVDLKPKTVPLELLQTRETVFKSKGRTLNSHRVTNALASCSLVRLFKKRQAVRHQGGCTLIDGSGSMRFTEQTIRDLMLSAPAQTIAYYQGYGHPDAEGYVGVLYIVAKDGMMYEGRLPHAGGGNDVDKWAIEYLTQQEQPWVFVTDGHFCGGPVGQAQQARVWLQTLVQAGKVIWLQDVPEALAYFRKLSGGKWKE